MGRYCATLANLSLPITTSPTSNRPVDVHITKHTERQTASGTPPERDQERKNSPNGKGETGEGVTVTAIYRIVVAIASRWLYFKHSPLPKAFSSSSEEMEYAARGRQRPTRTLNSVDRPEYTINREFAESHSEQHRKQLEVVVVGWGG